MRARSSMQSATKYFRVPLPLHSHQGQQIQSLVVSARTTRNGDPMLLSCTYLNHRPQYFKTSTHSLSSCIGTHLHPSSHLRLTFLFAVDCHLNFAYWQSCNRPGSLQSRDALSLSIFVLLRLKPSKCLAFHHASTIDKHPSVGPSADCVLTSSCSRAST